MACKLSHIVLILFMSLPTEATVFGGEECAARMQSIMSIFVLLELRGALMSCDLFELTMPEKFSIALNFPTISLLGIL